MKKLYMYFTVFLLFLTANLLAYADSDITGRWAEKISERVVMDIYQDKNAADYQIFITWREDNLAQKDIYRFNAKLNSNDTLQYKNGVHLYRYFNENNTFEDKTDYLDGSGTIKLCDDKLVWHDDKDNSETEFIRANKDLIKDTTVKNKLFSITIPEELKGIYEIETEKDKIAIYHKDSKKAGFGGFAFGIKAYKNPADHATLPGSRKLGELTDKHGVLYDIVLKHPTDVQHDYTKDPEAPESFKLLYNFGEIANIQGIDGSTYFKNQGTKGKDLYNDILNKHIRAIQEKWNSTKLEKENMSYMYNVINQPKTKALNKIGYTYYDVNVDGIDELLIGEITKGNLKGVVYDMYTMVDRKPQHVMSGGARNRYYVCDNAFVCNEYSSGALESGMRVYILTENSTELFHQVSFKYDGYANSKNPWFWSYGSDEWENVSEKDFKERKQIFERYERFDFTPLDNFLKSQNQTNKTLEDKYNTKKDYFDYSVVLTEFPKSYYYTTVKINKSKERILIVTDKINSDKTANHGLFYYFAKNGFVYPLGYLKSEKPLAQSKNYLYLIENNKNTKFYMSDKKLEIIKTKADKINETLNNIEFETIKSADRFAGDFGEAAGDDVVRATVDGFYFEYHKPQYKKKYIENLMRECIKDGVKTQVQMYCQMVKKLHP